MNVFNLPDLGEGLAEAEVREWYVSPGDSVKTGDPLLAVETAKAIVEIPAPWDGTIEELFAVADDIISVGSPLVGFTGDMPLDHETQEAKASTDTGTVVGEVSRSDEVVRESAEGIGKPGAGIKALPAVRALARKLDVDLSMVTPSGPDGQIIASDVERVAGILARSGPMELLRGPRRAMARTMSYAHSEVADVTVTEDADISLWQPGTDTTIRLVQAVAAGCRAEPALNAWYDAHAMGRRVLPRLIWGWLLIPPRDCLYLCCGMSPIVVPTTCAMPWIESRKMCVGAKYHRRKCADTLSPSPIMVFSAVAIQTRLWCPPLLQYWARAVSASRFWPLLENPPCAG